MVLPTNAGYSQPKSLGQQSADLGYDPRYEVGAKNGPRPKKDPGTLVDPSAPAISAADALGPGIAAKNIKGQKLAAGDINDARKAEQAVRKQQGQIVPSLQAAAAGQGPSAAQIASRANLNQLSLAQQRAAASIRGGAPGIYAAQHAAAAGLNPLQANAIANGGAARATELNRAQQVLAQQLLATRQGDIGMAGTDAAVASRNADLAQYAATANQANQLRAGEANLTDQVNAGQLDLNDQVRMGLARQQLGLSNQEAKDARALGNANLDLGYAGADVAAMNAANSAYLGQLGLGLRGATLQAGQAIGNDQRDAAFWSGLLTGGAAPIALGAIPNAPQQTATPAPALPTPQTQLTPPSLLQPPAQPQPSLATPTLQLQPMTSPQQMYAAYGY